MKNARIFIQNSCRYAVAVENGSKIEARYM
jgi:hypothetical protein